MWVNRKFFEGILETCRQHEERSNQDRGLIGGYQAREILQITQKAKDDITIDWMRHRINSLEKMNALFMQKIAGIALPVPEIVPTRPGSMTIPDFSAMPSFEDIGDAEARALGIQHDEAGELMFTK
jgi:hypothetical protein